MDYTKDLRLLGRNVLLIYNAYRSHISLEVLEVFLRNDIVVYALPSHSSGKTQPLDFVLFTAFKGALNNAVSSCSGFCDGRTLDLFHLCPVMGKPYEVSFDRSNFMAGFRRARLWPLDGSWLLDTPRPASAACVAPLVSIESLEKAYQEKILELRNATLGTDAKMLGCGYVNSHNRCVMTSATVLELNRKKEREQMKKREEGKRVVLGWCSITADE